MKIVSSEYLKNMLFHKLLFLFCFDIQNNFGTQHVLQMLRASEKDLPVTKYNIFVTHLLAFPLHAFPSTGPMTKMQKFFGAHNQTMCIATDIVTLFTIFRTWKNNTTELGPL